MRVSAKARLGLRVMLELARQDGRGPVGVRTLSGRQGASAKYTEAVVAMLKAGGLVTAVRGTNGGYTLARPAARVSVLEVFERLDGSLNQIECRGCPGTCRGPEGCE